MCFGAVLGSYRHLIDKASVLSSSKLGLDREYYIMHFFKAQRAFQVAHDLGSPFGNPSTHPRLYFGTRQQRRRRRSSTMAAVLKPRMRHTTQNTQYTYVPPSSAIHRRRWIHKLTVNA